MDVLSLVLLVAAQSVAPSITARFIGNAAFELSDGSTTILIDFPYGSGAFGYMQFPASELHRRSNALCLFTHGHADHFDGTAITSVGCQVAGPGEVQQAVPAEFRYGPGPRWEFRGVRIECIPTPHADVEHCSYVIEWLGNEIYVSGDIEDLDALDDPRLNARSLFLPAWLVSAVATRSLPADTRVVVHHHTATEEIPPCNSCFVPRQGATFPIGGCRSSAGG